MSTSPTHTAKKATDQQLTVKSIGDFFKVGAMSGCAGALRTMIELTQQVCDGRMTWEEAHKKMERDISEAKKKEGAGSSSAGSKKEPDQKKGEKRKLNDDSDKKAPQKKAKKQLKVTRVRKRPIEPNDIPVGGYIKKVVEFGEIFGRRIDWGDGTMKREMFVSLNDGCIEFREYKHDSPWEYQHDTFDPNDGIYEREEGSWHVVRIWE